MNPQQLLRKRELELDAREKYIAEQEAAAKELTGDLKSLQAKVKHETKALADLKDTSRTAELELKVTIDRLNDRIRTLKRQHEELLGEKANTETQINQLTFEAGELRTLLDQLGQQATQAKQELQATHQAVQDALQSVELAKQDSQASFTAARELQAKLDAENETAAGELLDIADKVEAAKQELDAVRLDAERAEALKQRNLTYLEDKITKAKAQFAAVKAETDVKLKQLKVKEQSLLTKQTVIRNERADLDVERRRLNSVKSLYNDD